MAATAPGTVNAAILPGWMDRAKAIELLTTQCVEPAFSVEAATATWEDYQHRVAALPERVAPAPGRQVLTASEQGQVNQFLHRYRKSGAANILQVIKVDPMACVIHQLQVITDRADGYAKAMSTPALKLNHCLGTHAAQPSLAVANSPEGLRFQLPHAEFLLNFDVAHGLQIQQLARHISVTAFNDRMLLWGGYHRTFALMATHNPEAMERSLVVVLTTDADFVFSGASATQGLADMLRGLRPPLFADFFNDGLCMRVKLRKKRYELLVQAKVLPLDDPT